MSDRDELTRRAEALERWREMRRACRDGRLDVLASVAREAIGMTSAAHAAIGAPPTFRAIHSLGLIGGESEVPLLLEILAAGAEESRECAAASLGRIRSAASVDGLVASLGDESDRVRMAALLALGDIGDARCLPAVEPLLESPNWRVRGSAIYALHGLPDPRARTLAAQALARSDWKLRRVLRLITRRRRWYLRANRARHLRRARRRLGR